MQESEHPTLQDLRAAAQGDRERLGALLARYQARLAAVAIATGAYRAVDDVVQEALIKIMRAIRDGGVTVTSAEQFRSWAQTVARNTALDSLRREGRQMRHIESVIRATVDDSAAEVVGSEPSPSQCAMVGERMSKLRRLREAREDVVATLRRPDQMLVWMRERDGMTFPAIAAVLGGILGVALTADMLRMRYARLTAGEIGSPVDESAS